MTGYGMAGGHIVAKCRFFAEKKERIFVPKLLTDNLDLNELCFRAFFSTAWGTVIRIKPGNEKKKLFLVPALGTDIG